MKTLLVTALLNAEQEIMAVYDSFEDALAAAEGTNRTVADEEWLAQQTMGMLAEIFNKNSEYPVKRFSTKEVAVKRVLGVIADVQIALAEKEAADTARRAENAAAVQAMYSTPAEAVTDEQQAMLAQSASADRVATATADAYNADAAAEVTEIAATSGFTTTSINKVNAIAELAGRINAVAVREVAKAKAVEVSVKLDTKLTVYVVPSTKNDTCRMYVMGSARETLAGDITNMLGVKPAESKGASTWANVPKDTAVSVIASLLC